MALEASATPALQVGPGVAATVHATRIQGNACVDAPDAGAADDRQVDPDQPRRLDLRELGVHSTLRHSTVDRIGVLNKASVPASVVTTGTVEDTQVDGGLQLAGPSAVAQRVRASGWTAIWVRVSSSTRWRAAATVPRSRPTRRRAEPCVSSTRRPSQPAPRPCWPPCGPPPRRSHRTCSRSPTRSRGADRATSRRRTSPCSSSSLRDPVEIAIDHSNFAVRVPAANAPGRGGHHPKGTGNQSADPRFVERRRGDFHLRAGSPAIDAGTSQARRAPARPRRPAASPGCRAGPRCVRDAGRDRRRRARWVGKRRFGSSRHPGPRPRASEPAARPLPGRRPRHGDHDHDQRAGHITVAVQQRIAGRRNHGRCVTRAPKKAPRCTRWVQRGPALTRRVAAPGRVTVAFSGRIGDRRLSRAVIASSSPPPTKPATARAAGRSRSPSSHRGGDPPRRRGGRGAASRAPGRPSTTTAAVVSAICTPSDRTTRPRAAQRRR